MSFHGTVFGCGDMTPPDGAWMTRDGDVIEIGCHSGSKTWRLECRDNQWMGSVGFCGRGNENLPKHREQDIRKDEENLLKQTQVLNVSPGTNASVVQLSRITEIKLNFLNVFRRVCVRNFKSGHSCQFHHLLGWSSHS